MPRNAGGAVLPMRSKSPAMHGVAELLLGRQWAMQPERLQGLRVLAEQKLANPNALTAWADASVPETFLATQRDGIATLRITGPMERTWSFWAWLFGGTTYDVLAADVERLRNDAAIRAVILEFDTPGGDVHGAGELAAMIRAADAVKPFVAHVAGVGASAGYWLASAARRVVVDPSAVVGSIGVIATFIDTSGLEQDLGIEFIEMVSTQSPRKAMDPTTDQGRADWQQLLDSLAAVFITDVATYRGVPVETVLEDFGQGGVFVGQEAIDAGLADAIGTHDVVHAALLEELDGAPDTINLLEAAMPVSVARARSKTTKARTSDPASTRLATRTRAQEDPPQDDEEDEQETPPEGKQAETDGDEEEDTASAAPTGQQTAPVSIDAAWVRANAPTAAAEIATAERERILAIHGLTLKVPGAKAQAVILAGMKDPSATKASVSEQLLDAGIAQGAAALAGLAGDEAALDPPSNSDDPSAATSEIDRAVRSILTAGKPTPARRT
jgi:signal peptide peptidase SppA